MKASDYKSKPSKAALRYCLKIQFKLGSSRDSGKGLRASGRVWDIKVGLMTASLQLLKL